MKDLNIDDLLKIINEDFTGILGEYRFPDEALNELVRRARAYDRLIKEAPITKTTWKH